MVDNTEYHNNDPNQEKFCRLFIGKLSSKTTEESLRTYFEKWGQVVKCEILRHPSTGVNYECGFLTFQTADQLNEAQLHRPHKIDDKEIYTRRAMPSGTLEETIRSRELCINGLHKTVCEKSVFEVFSKYGTIENVIMFDAMGQRMPYCYLTFVDYDSADLCILIRYFHLGPSVVEVKRASLKYYIECCYAVDPAGGAHVESNAYSNNYDGSVNNCGNVAATYNTTVTELPEEYAKATIDSREILMAKQTLYRELFNARSALMQELCKQIQNLLHSKTRADIAKTSD